VAHGSTDLSELAIAYRRAENIGDGRNVAVFEYRVGNTTEIATLTLGSQRGVGHAEARISAALEELGVPPDRVTRIYTELEPCARCQLDVIDERFPDAKVTFSFRYGSSRGSRAAGVRSLRKAARNDFRDFNMRVYRIP
jgi:hypothetical protein